MAMNGNSDDQHHLKSPLLAHFALARLVTIIAPA